MPKAMRKVPKDYMTGNLEPLNRAQMDAFFDESDYDDTLSEEELKELCKVPCYVEIHRSNICKKFEDYVVKNVLKKSNVKELTDEQMENMFEQMESKGVALYNEFINMKKYQKLRTCRREYRLDAYLFVRRRKRFYEKIKALGEQPDSPEPEDDSEQVVSSNQFNPYFSTPGNKYGLEDDEYESLSSVVTSQTVVTKKDFEEYKRFNYLSSQSMSKTSQPVPAEADTESDYDDDAMTDGISQAMDAFSALDVRKPIIPSGGCEEISLGNKNSQVLETYTQFEKAHTIVSSTQGPGVA